MFCGAATDSRTWGAELVPPLSRVARAWSAFKKKTSERSLKETHCPLACCVGFLWKSKFCKVIKLYVESEEAGNSYMSRRRLTNQNRVEQLANQSTSALSALKRQKCFRQRLKRGAAAIGSMRKVTQEPVNNNNCSGKNPLTRCLTAKTS